MLERARSILAASVRSFATAPLPAGAAALTLATAVGLNLAMAGLIERALLSPPAHIVDPGRVVSMAFHLPGDNTAAAMTTTSYVTFETLRRDVPAFAQAAAWQRIADRVMVDGEQLPAQVMLVSGRYFELLGSRATLGRAVLPADDESGAAAPIVVLGYEFWVSALHRDGSALGRHLNVGGLDYEIAGVTMSVLLLAGTGMFGRSLYALAAQDFGMRMDGVADMEPGHAEPPGVGRQLPFLNAATPDFLRILGIEVIEGRSFTEADDRGAPVVIVNETMARQVWPGESALGQCIRIGFDADFHPSTATGPPTPSDRVVCREVVGVARDVRQRSVLPVDNETRLMQYFVPYSQVPRPPFAANPQRLAWGLLVQAAVPPEAIGGAIRRAIVGSRADLPFVRVRPYAQLLDRQLRPWRLGTTLLALFSGVALAVAALGLYAVFAHAVSERKREMAIRLAVGASPAGLLRMVLGKALLVASAGGVLGALAAVGAGQWVRSLLYGTAPSDPFVLVGAALLMLAVTLIATVAPARSAAASDPTTLLRAD